jgi:hypothetical protein
MAAFEVDRNSHSYMLGVAEYDRDKYLTALRRIVSLDEKNVPKYAQQIAKDALGPVTPPRPDRKQP